MFLHCLVAPPDQRFVSAKPLHQQRQKSGQLSRLSEGTIVMTRGRLRFEFTVLPIAALNEALGRRFRHIDDGGQCCCKDKLHHAQNLRQTKIVGRDCRGRDLSSDGLG